MNELTEGNSRTLPIYLDMSVDVEKNAVKYKLNYFWHNTHFGRFMKLIMEKKKKNSLSLHKMTHCVELG